MQRRRYLSALAATTTLGLAGCSGDTADNNSSDGGSGSGTEASDGGETEASTETETEAGTDTQEATETGTANETETLAETAGEEAGNETPTETNTSTENETTTATESSSGEADIQTSPGEIETDDSGYSTDTYVPVEVTNEGGGASGQIKLTAKWYNGNGDYLNDDSAYLQMLEGGETWLARIEALGTEDIADFELTAEVEDEPPQSPSDVELLESELQTGEDEASVTGRVENNTGDELGYLEAIAQVYDADGNILGDGYTNQTEIPEGETWRFSIDRLLSSRIDQIDDHEALLDASV